MEWACIKKEDINQLWALQCKIGIYIFKKLKPCAHKDDLLNNFYYYFGNRNDYIIKEKEQIAGLCSLNHIMWKNSSCSVSYQLCLPELTDAFMNGFTGFLHYLKDDLHISVIRMYVENGQLSELQRFGVDIFVEGTLREHVFTNGRYTDVHIITINPCKKKEGNPIV